MILTKWIQSISFLSFVELVLFFIVLMRLENPIKYHISKCKGIFTQFLSRTGHLYNFLTAHAQSIIISNLFYDKDK